MGIFSKGDYLEQTPLGGVSDSLIPRQVPKGGAVAPLLASSQAHCVGHRLHDPHDFKGNDNPEQRSASYWQGEAVHPIIHAALTL